MSKTDREAARIALHVLRAILPSSVEGDQLRRLAVRGRKETLDEEQAIVLLETLPKPLECAADAKDAVLELEAIHLPTLEGGSAADSSADPGLLSDHLLTATRRSSGARILLRGRDGAQLETTFDAFAQFTRHYRIRGHYYVIGDFPSLRDAESGITWVLSFSPSHSVTNVKESS